MKAIVFLMLLIGLNINGMAQKTTAQDWTRTDCDGNTHSLFGYLQGGQIVMMQFDMMNCIYCTTAATYTDKIYQRFNISHPGKLVMVSMGYTNSTVCSDMQAWKNKYGFTFHTIEKCPNELAYYGNMGMPTIVIAAGWSHKIFYYKEGFQASDTTAINAALNSALVVSGIQPETEPSSSHITLEPNPASSMLTISLGEQKAEQVVLADLTGRTLLTQNNTDKSNLFNLPLQSLRAGIYFVTVFNDGFPVARSRFIKQ